MPEIKKYKITEPYLDLKCRLGEGPFWEESRNTLRFVDIDEKKLHFVDLSTGPSSHREVNLEHSISVTADVEGNDDEFVFGGKLGYGIFDRATGTTRWIRMMWNDDERKPDGGGKPGVGANKEERMRSNDGAVDKMGRFWVGAMNDNALVGSKFTDEGVLFRLDPDLSLHRMKDAVTIPNGTSWSSDDSEMYFTDSPSGEIRAYPYDSATGDVDFSKGRTFFRCPIPGGVPDGHCQDEEGCRWIACHGTGKVLRVDRSGVVVAEVELPTACVTCPVLCGTELFITSEHEVEPEKRPWSLKYQGALFKVDVGVRGRPLNKFKMVSKV